MKLIIKKELLLKGVQAVEKNVGRNLTLPILNNILIKTQKDYLNFISTDLELAVSVSVPAKIDKEGSIVVPSRILSSFLNNISEGNTQLETKNNNLHVEQDDYKTKIKGESGKEFPLLPKLNKKTSFTISSADLIQGLEQTINSVAASDLKPELTGVLFSLSKGELKLASTDSFRLSEKTLSEKKGIQQIGQNIIIPAKTVQEIMRSFQNTGDQLDFYVENNQIAVENKNNKNFNLLIISKLLEGDYPQYTQIIPSEFKTNIIVSKKDFTKQIKAASLFASRINDVKLNVGEKSIEIRAANSDVGDFQSSVAASVRGEKKEMVFNYQYLLDGVHNIDGDEVVIKLNKSDGPVILESTRHKDYFYVLMSLRG